MNFVHRQTIEAKPSLSGKALDEHLSLMRPGARALLALSLTRDVTLTRLTRAQAARVVEVPPYSVAIAALATLDERFGLKQGRITLSDVRKAHARKPSDDDIIAFINAVDPARILEILDAMTAPPQLVAAE
jgi:hypothetical protein